MVWETKPKKKRRWKVLSGKDAEMLEQHYKVYTESNPLDYCILDLENGYQVTHHIQIKSEPLKKYCYACP